MKNVIKPSYMLGQIVNIDFKDLEDIFDIDPEFNNTEECIMVSKNINSKKSTFYHLFVEKDEFVIPLMFLSKTSFLIILNDS